MKKVLVFGTGNSYIRRKEIINNNFQVEAFLDNNREKQGTIFENKKVISPEQLCKYTFDYIIVSSAYYNDIQEQLLDIGVAYNKIIDIVFLEKEEYPLESIIYQSQICNHYKSVLDIGGKLRKSGLFSRTFKYNNFEKNYCTFQNSQNLSMIKDNLAEEIMPIHKGVYDCIYDQIDEVNEVYELALYFGEFNIDIFQLYRNILKGKALNFMCILGKNEEQIQTNFDSIITINIINNKEYKYEIIETNFCKLLKINIG